MSRCVVTEVEAAGEVFATLQVPHDSLAGCCSWSLWFADYSSGASVNRRSSLLAVGWYLRFSLSYRDGEELLAERGLWSTTLPSGDGCSVTPPEMERRLRRRLKPTADSWRADETHIRIKGKWR